MAKKKSITYRAKVIEAFKKNKDGVIKQYNVDDTYITNHYPSIEYLKLIKKLK
jgi:hypothetical protein